MTDRVVASLGLAHRCTVRAVDVSVAAIEAGAGPAFDAFVWRPEPPWQRTLRKRSCSAVPG